MSRSKKNWDYLVDDLGNYDPLGTGSGGGGGGTGSKGAKGEKGDEGPIGPKGEKLEFGDLTPADKEALKGDPGADGADGVGDKGEKGDPGGDGIDGAAGDKGEPGDKGEDGAAGEKGEDGTSVKLLGAVDDLAALNALSGPHEPGDLWVVANDGSGLENVAYVWSDTNGGEWVAVGPITGPKGEKGEDGKSALEILIEGGTLPPGSGPDELAEILKGEKGEDGADGESAYDSAVKGGFVGTESEWVESLKGEKGDVDDLLDQVLPEAAFDVYDNSQNTVIQSGTVDFRSNDQTADIYKRGLITLGKTVMVEHAPMEAQAFMLANYVVFDTTPEGDPKNNDYTVIQMLYNGTAVDATRNVGRDDATNAYWRRARPGRNQFTAWRSLEFDTEKYYLKSEVENLIDEGNTTYALSAEEGAADDTASVILTDSDDVTSQVNLKVTGGLSIAVAGTDVTIDASAFSGGAIFLGPITAPQDPATLFGAGNPAVGSYYVYTNSDDSWNGEVVNAGDWAAYSASGWINLNYITSNVGVIEVQGQTPITVDSTDAARPIVGIDIDALKTDLDWDNQVSLEQLLDLAETRLLGDLADVTIGYDAEYECTYSIKNGTFPTSPDMATPGGTYNVDVTSKTVYFGRRTNIGDSQTVIDLYNNTTNGQTYHTFSASDGSWTQSALVVQKQDTGDAFAYTYESPSLLAQLNGPEQEFVVGVRGASTAEDGDVLVWNESMGQWVPGSPQDNSGNLVDKQVVYAGPDGEFLSTPKLTIEATHVEGASDILPDADLTRSLGSADKRWKEIHTDSVVIGDNGEAFDGSLDSVCKVGAETDINVTVGSLIYMDDGLDAFNGGPNELEARNGSDSGGSEYASFVKTFNVSETHRQFVYGNGVWICRNDSNVDGKYIALSTNTVDWTRVITPTAFSRIVWHEAEGEFVASHIHDIYTSPDGENWTKKDGAPNQSFFLAYNGYYYYRYGDYASMRTKSDFTEEELIFNYNDDPWEATRFLAAAGKVFAFPFSVDWSTPKVYGYSDDSGETWSERPISGAGAAFANEQFGLVEHNGVIFMHSDGVVTGPNRQNLYKSTDGGLSFDPIDNEFRVLEWKGLVSNGQKLIGCAYNRQDRTTDFYESTDGENWIKFDTNIVPWHGPFDLPVVIAADGNLGVLHRYGAAFIPLTTGETPGLYFNDELVATSANLSPVINAVNNNSETITNIQNGNIQIWNGDATPTVGPDGEPIKEGQLFLHTGIFKILVYVGGAWTTVS